MAEERGDSVEQKSEASTVEMTQENGQNSIKNNKKLSALQSKRKPENNVTGKTTTCKVVLLDGTDFESHVDVCLEH